LRRIDLLAENLYIITLLIISGICIFFINVPGRMHFWLLFVLQFCFGGLFSTFLVFYSRSASFGASWPFLLVLVLIMIGNEVFKKHYSRFVFQLSVYFFALFSFSVFAIPLLIHKLGAWVFILSEAVSVVLICLFILFINFFSPTARKAGRLIFVSLGSIFILLNFLYFTDLIPPLPLSLKESGVYHELNKNAEGNYVVKKEVAPLKDIVTGYRTFHLVRGQAAYVYSAVFSPSKLDAKVVHHWQHYDDTEDKWIEYGKIRLNVVGGRDGGYRTYSAVYNLKPGKWRVNVETEGGQIIGRIKFRVVASSTVPPLVQEIK
jgi:hypothetical protein